MLGVYKQLTTCRDQLNDKSDGPEVTGDMTLFINGYTSWVPMCAKLVESRQWGSSGVWLRDAEPVYRCRRNTWEAVSAKWRNLNALLQSAGSNSSQRWALKFLQRCERTSYKQKNKKIKMGQLKTFWFQSVKSYADRLKARNQSISLFCRRLCSLRLSAGWQRPNNSIGQAQSNIMTKCLTA